MSVALRGTPTSNEAASGTTNVVNKPTGVVSGDILILDVGWGPVGTTATAPSGFTLLKSTAFSDNSWTQSTYFKIAGGSEPSTYTTSFSGSTFSDIILIAYSGADPAATPLSSTNTGTGTTATGTGLTFTVDGSMLLHCSVSSNNARTGGPSGMTNEITFATNMYIDDQSVNSGASGNKTSTYSPSQIWLVQMIGIQPVATATNPPVGQQPHPAIDSWQAPMPRVTSALGVAAVIAVATVAAQVPFARAQIPQWDTSWRPTNSAPAVALLPAPPPTDNPPLSAPRQIAPPWDTSWNAQRPIGFAPLIFVPASPPVVPTEDPVTWTNPTWPVRFTPSVAAITAPPPPLDAPLPRRAKPSPTWDLLWDARRSPPIAAVIPAAVSAAPPTVAPAGPITWTSPTWDARRPPGSAGILASPATLPRYIPSANGRYHIDTVTGYPFPVLGDSGWVLANNVTSGNLATYLDDRVQKGFTSIIVQLMALGSSAFTLTAGNPSDANGNLPFTLNNSGGSYTGTAGTADFSTPNDAYWTYVRQVVDAITSRGLLAICYVDFWGFGGDGVQGAATDITNSANTSTVCQNFGAYLANGHGTFGGFAGVAGAWFADGGDFGANHSPAPSATLENRTLSIALGMRQNGCTHLRYFDGQSPSMGTDEAAFTAECHTQAVYTYGGIFGVDGPTSPALHTYQQSRLGWNYSPVSASQGPYGSTSPPAAIPAWLKETIYAHDTSVINPAKQSDIRKAEYWAWLSGCTAGIVHGNDNIWDFRTGGVWQSALNDSWEQDAARKNFLWRSLRWWDFVPSELSGLRRLITSANGTQTGTPDSYVAACQTSAGDQLVAYIPTFSTGAQSITVDLRSMASGTLRARWWDPTNGTWTGISGVFDNSLSAQGFTTPGANSASPDNDWILIVDLAPQPTPKPVIPDWTPPIVSRAIAPSVAAILATASVVSNPPLLSPRQLISWPDWQVPRQMAGMAGILATSGLDVPLQHGQPPPRFPDPSPLGQIKTSLAAILATQGLNSFPAPTRSPAGWYDAAPIQQPRPGVAVFAAAPVVSAPPTVPPVGLVQDWPIGPITRLPPAIAALLATPPVVNSPPIGRPSASWWITPQITRASVPGVAAITFVAPTASAPLPVTRALVSWAPETRPIIQPVQLAAIIASATTISQGSILFADDSATKPAKLEWKRTHS